MRSASTEFLHDFASLRTRAPELWQADEARDLFLGADWFEALHASGFDAALPLQLLLQRQADGRAHCLPLVGTPAGLQSLSNYYSCLYGAIGAGIPDWPALIATLRAQPGAARLRLQPLNAEDPQLAALEQGLRQAGYWVDRFFCFGNWYLPCRGLRYADYLQGRASQLRNTLARGQRRLAREGGWAIEICRGEDEQQLARCLADYEAIYAASWKSAESHPAFIRALVRLAARGGWLRLGVLRLQGQALAAQLWWVKGGRACIYKLAYREEAGRYSAGTVLTAALMAHALEIDQVHEIDYLSGDDAYKREWMSERRERVGLLAFDPRRASGLLAAARHRIGKTWRRLRAPR